MVPVVTDKLITLAGNVEMANSMEYMNTMQAAIDTYNVQMGANLQLYVPSQIQETNWVKEISEKTRKQVPVYQHFRWK